MNTFHYHQGDLYCEDLSLAAIAQHYQTPCYVYSEAALRERYHSFSNALGDNTQVCYAVKANSNLAVLRLFAEMGAGFDIVSGGELERVLRAGGAAKKIIFSGVGKSADEIRTALSAGIACLNVESAAELWRIADIAADMGLRAPIALRVNPDVDPGTHAYIATGLKESKFGIPMDAARALYLEAAKHPALELKGIACHIGSQLLNLAPLGEAVTRVRALYEDLFAQGLTLEHLDLGGGVGIRYHEETPPSPADYAEVLNQTLQGLAVNRAVELGRALVGNAGVLLTRVEYLKDNGSKQFCVVDAAMNDLLRPALYGAWHDILPLRQDVAAEQVMDVVGPICESGDFIAKDRSVRAEAAQLLAIMGAGAYGFAMSSNYNSRPRPPEVLVHGHQHRLIRRRENWDDLMGMELP
ncbi:MULTISPECIES: diaminopimelate decarboxylase [Acidithiobacillus]|uniref:Diaminopimelate decarboxylase n=1 Tax=Acidithiobacillus concretivorus TaxID=3063952 RepID=A0ABS5ZMT8_9PROT|nr:MULTISPECIES: diaminopimelate decarboxylase [Acidithiobacillus]MBU2737805.1 diaminopimelate decarboxylase [Acidithiobacillus concretivorus]MDD2749022.1 diaminopimelate decarboxylase [Acidithiobacillus sp.]MDD5280338.1 diaminopimelate decarboxylase [Acidithiobacillus sp.]